jgi:hypothetical protein
MQRNMTGSSEQRVLHRFIGLAFEATRHLSGDRIVGNADGFLSRLYLQRMGSVFGEPVDSPQGTPPDFTSVIDRLDDMFDRRAEDILPGRIRRFSFDDPNWGPGQTGGSANEHGHERFRDDLGIEAYATYFPIHFFPADRWLNSRWGIYISEFGVRKVAEVLKKGFIEQYGPPDGESEVPFLRIAFEVLLRHEMEHFKIESFALNAELLQRTAIYVPYLFDVYASTYNTHYCLEEALANATVLRSTVIKRLIQEIYPQEKTTAWANIITKYLFDSQPRGYSNYDLREPWHGESDRNRLRQVSLTHSLRRDAMNYLCNQIVAGKVLPDKDLFPFYAFPPDNYFLRAESLVPIYVLKDMDQRDAFINFPTPTRKVWERFLKRLGFCLSGGSGDHEIWKRPGFNIITNNFFKKELDSRSFKSALQTLEITRHEFNVYCNNDKIPDRLQQKLRDFEQQPVLT